MKTLITGAAGFIGRALSLRIQECGDFGTLALFDRQSASIGAFGSGRWMQQSENSGLSLSANKAKASRENGKRGGRRKKRAAA